VISEVPAVRVPPCVALFPTVTLPKFSLAGDTVNFAFSIPVPVSPADNGLESPGAATERLPCCAPATVGVKATVRLTLLPGGIVTGSEPAFTLNPGPVMSACETVIAAAPGAEALVRVMLCVLLLPSATLPKSTLETLRVNTVLFALVVET